MCACTHVLQSRSPGMNHRIHLPTCLSPTSFILTLQDSIGSSDLAPQIRTLCHSSTPLTKMTKETMVSCFIDSRQGHLVSSPPYSSPLKDNVHPVLYPYGTLPPLMMTLLLAKQGPHVESGTPRPRLLKVRIKAYRMNTILLVQYLTN